MKMLCKTAKTFTQPTVLTSVEGDDGPLTDNHLIQSRSHFASPTSRVLHVEACIHLRPLNKLITQRGYISQRAVAA